MQFLIPILATLAALMVAYWIFLSEKIIDIVDELPTHSGKKYGTRTRSQITTLIIHHSASENQGPYDYAAYHIQEKQWPGIAYHFVIQPNGDIFQTNRLETVSYHTEGFNTPGVGICLSGNLSDHRMTDAQESALVWLLRKLKRSIPTVSRITGHRDHKATDCPGDYVSVEAIVAKI